MDEKELLEKFNFKFGTNFWIRLKKLKEEYNEFIEATQVELFEKSNDDFLNDIVDELSDVNALIFHIAGILGFTQKELLEMAVDKIRGRETDPFYKRKHPHGVKAIKPRVTEFERELSDLINRYGLDSSSNTPDFILARFAVNTLQAFAENSKDRDNWHGFQPDLSEHRCETCLFFSNEEIDGSGVCSKNGRVTHRNLSKCNEWKYCDSRMKVRKEEQEPGESDKAYSAVCGNCRFFEQPDEEGDAYCMKENRRRHLSTIACEKWENGIGN